jgi:hypothetical protein
MEWLGEWLGALGAWNGSAQTVPLKAPMAPKGHQEPSAAIAGEAVI